MAFPLIFESNEVNYTSQGYGALSDAISCVVTEELNGAFELEMRYPARGLHSEYIIPDNLIVCAANQNHLRQAFRIYEVKQEINGIATIHARHISYDLNGYPVEPFTAANLSDALAGLLANGQFPPPFTIEADFSSSADFEVTEPSPVRSWFGGREGSIIDVFGGEWEYDNHRCFLRAKRGENNGVRAQYGKNISKYTKDVKSDSLYSHVCAFWRDTEDGTIVQGDYVPTGITQVTRVKFIDTSADYEAAPSVADLTAYATAQAGNFRALSLNVSVDVVPLDDVQDLIELGDVVHVYYQGDIFQTRCVSVVWNVIKELYDSVSVGALKTSLASTISSSVASDGYATKKEVASAIQKNTKLIEVGTDGGWNYRKYADGTYEADKELTVSSLPTSYAWGSLYRTAGVRFGNLPSFDSGDGFGMTVGYIVDESITNTTGAGWAVCFYAPNRSSDPSPTGVWVIASTSASNTAKGILTAHIVGTWN